MSASDSTDRRTITELRRMDRETARAELTVPEYERWDALHDRLDGAEQTRDEWADADETALDVTVHADDEELGETVGVFGNELLVRIDPEKPGLRKRANALRDEFGDEERDIDDLDDIDADRLANRVVDLYDEIVIAWNGTRLETMSAAERETLFETVREKWGLRGLFLGLADIIAGVEKGQQERLEAVESFRGAKRGRRN